MASEPKPKAIKGGGMSSAYYTAKNLAVSADPVKAIQKQMTTMSKSPPSSGAQQFGQRLQAVTGWMH